MKQRSLHPLAENGNRRGQINLLGEKIPEFRSHNQEGSLACFYLASIIREAVLQVCRSQSI